MRTSATSEPREERAVLRLQGMWGSMLMFLRVGPANRRLKKWGPMLVAILWVSIGDRGPVLVDATMYDCYRVGVAATNKCRSGEDHRLWVLDHCPAREKVESVPRSQLVVSENKGTPI